MLAAAWHQEANLPEAGHWEIIANLVRAKIVFFEYCEFELKSNVGKLKSRCSAGLLDAMQLTRKQVSAGLWDGGFGVEMGSKIAQKWVPILVRFWVRFTVQGQYSNHVFLLGPVHRILCTGHGRPLGAWPAVYTGFCVQRLYPLLIALGCLLDAS